MKNQMLKVQEKKLQQQLQQKKEMGKAEYEVENESVGKHKADNAGKGGTFINYDLVVSKQLCMVLSAGHRKFSWTMMSRELTKIWMKFKSTV